jgi:hypothetical protein
MFKLLNSYSDKDFYYNLLIKYIDHKNQDVRISSLILLLKTKNTTGAEAIQRYITLSEKLLVSKGDLEFCDHEFHFEFELQRQLLNSFQSSIIDRISGSFEDILNHEKPILHQRHLQPSTFITEPVTPSNKEWHNHISVAFDIERISLNHENRRIVVNYFLTNPKNTGLTYLVLLIKYEWLWDLIQSDIKG